MQSGDGKFYPTEMVFLQGAEATSNTPQDFSALSAKGKIFSPKGFFGRPRANFATQQDFSALRAGEKIYVYQTDSALRAIENFPVKKSSPSALPLANSANFQSANSANFPLANSAKKYPKAQESHMLQRLGSFQ